MNLPTVLLKLLLDLGTELFSSKAVEKTSEHVYNDEIRGLQKWEIFSLNDI